MPASAKSTMKAMAAMKAMKAMRAVKATKAMKAMKTVKAAKAKSKRAEDNKKVDRMLKQCKFRDYIIGEFYTVRNWNRKFGVMYPRSLEKYLFTLPLCLMCLASFRYS